MSRVRKGSNNNNAMMMVVILVTTLTTSLLHATTTYAQSCDSSGQLTGTEAPVGECDPNGADCCEAGVEYNTYTCSPSVTGQTNAVLTLNSFEEGGDGGGESQCDGQFHSDSTPVVALSTGWYDRGLRCGKEIIINGNGQSTRARVVDQCDSTVGCDEEHGYQVPCKNNVVDASEAVWTALGVSSDDDQYGQMAITWSDA